MRDIWPDAGMARRRDSPRIGFTYAAFRVRRIQPLCRNAPFARRANLSRSDRLLRRANQWLQSARLALDKEGRIAIVTDVGLRDAMDAWAARDERKP
jgi:hypothetical protein